METMELPKVKVKASRKSPKNMIIYGAPKIGKTTVLSKLDNCLIIDLEDGSDMVDALKVKANNLKELQAVGSAIIKEGRPYKYIAIDTISPAHLRPDCCRSSRSQSHISDKDA